MPANLGDELCEPLFDREECIDLSHGKELFRGHDRVSLRVRKRLLRGFAM